MREFGIAALLLLAIASSAAACDPRRMPPAYFDHEPTVPYKVFEWDVDMLLAACGGGYFPNPGGCAEKVADDLWYIYLSASSKSKKCLLRHEKGHVNGWEHSAMSSTKGREPK